MEDLETNPLNILNARRFDFLAPHLNPIQINENMYSSMNGDIPRWIEHNLKGRYFYGSITKLIDNRITSYKIVAFEDQYESTMFLLKCPYVGQK